MIVIKGLLTTEEVAAFRKVLLAAEWHEGVKTAGSLAKMVKQNLQLDDTSELANNLRNTVLRKLAVNAEFISSALPEKIYPPKFNCYCNGGHYGTHIDSAVMPIPGSYVNVRGDLSATLFLSDPDEYVGGELEVETDVGTHSLKLPAGDMVLYRSGSLHRVLPVTGGARYASFFWVESQVRDDTKRRILLDLDKTIQSLTLKLEPNDKSLIELTGHYHNLLRLWAGA